MAESRLLPCNFYGWPAVSSLSMLEKHVVIYAWTNRGSNSCGCYLFPVVAAAAEIGVGVDELKRCIDVLVAEHLVAFDWATSEIMIERWFAFHKFCMPAAKSMLWRDVERIESPRLRKAVLDKCPAEKNEYFRNAEKSKTCRSTQNNKTQIKSSVQPRAREPDSCDEHWRKIGEAIYFGGRDRGPREPAN